MSNDEISLLHQKINALQIQYEKLSVKYGILFKTPHANMTILEVFDLVMENTDKLSDMFIPIPKIGVNKEDVRRIFTGTKEP